MKDSTVNSSNQFSDGKLPLPLYDFFIALKRNNFLVTPKQVTDSNRLISQYSGVVKNEQELCNYLSPIFANSQEEQIQFKEIFEQYFKTADDKPPLDWWQIVKAHLKKHWWKYLSGLLFTVAAIMWGRNLFDDKKLNPRPVISIVTNVSDSFKAGHSNSNSYIKAMLLVNNSVTDTLPGLVLKAKYDWGDSTVIDTAADHTYKKEGIYWIKAFIDVYYKNRFQYKDTVDGDVGICLGGRSLFIEKSFSGDSVKVGEKIILKAVTGGKKPDSIYWTSTQDNKIVNIGSGNQITVSFDKEGVQQFFCNPVYDSANSPCIFQNNISFIVYDPAPKPTIKFSVAANANPLRPKYKVNQQWFYIAVFLAGLFLVLSSFFARRWAAAKKNPDKTDSKKNQQYENLIQSFAGTTGPVELPFHNKNYLPLPEQELNDVARQMRKRINDDATFMHVQKTITKAINNAGFFQPVLAARTQQSEYLVIIDENNTNNQQVKLFEYLLELLAKQSVFVEKYYYTYEPKLCYNAAVPGGISLEKLSEKYPKHVLLILGNAYQLIYQLYPVIDSAYLKLLNRWQYKAVLTPVSFLDWGNKEKKVLLEELPVLPVDIPGQLLLMQKIFGEETNVLAELQQYRNDFYETESIDFEDADELHDYCTNAAWANITGGVKYSNVLFQWIAALAVYPKIRWELTLAIGKAILDRYGNTSEMNFTNLLRIARIKWMKEGRFPDYTRLALLKHLEKENEIIARETILASLNEIPETDVNSTHFTYEEKETQKLINEFNLYAYDPVKYIAYKSSKDMFEQLAKNNQLTDMPAKNYFDNAGLNWSTLINKPTGNVSADSNTANISIDTYFGWNKQGSKRLKNIYLWATSLSAVCFVGALLGLIGLVILNFSNSRRFRAFTYKQAFADSVKFNFIDTSGYKSANEIVLNVDSTQVPLNNYQPAVLLLNINDSLKNIAVRVNGNILFDTSMMADYDDYNITLDKNKIPPAAVWPNFTTGTWILRNAVDSSGGNWNNSVLKFTSQKDTAGRLMLSGMFTWKRNSIVLGTEQVSGSYTADDRMIKLKGLSVSNLTAAGKVANLDLGTYTVSLSADEQRLIEGTWGSGSSTVKIVPLRNNKKWTATRDSVGNTGTTNPVPNPLINIRISDESLTSSAAAFANELRVKGYTVQKIDKGDYNENSRIYYYSTALAGKAGEVKKIYDKYYPQLNVLTRLMQMDRSVSSNNVITIWIKKYEVIKTGFEIKNIQFKQTLKTKELLEVSFDIVNNGFADRTKAYGSICIFSEPGCTDFSFSMIPSINISRAINVDNKTAGKHEIRVVVASLKIDQSLGFFTIEDPAKIPVEPPEEKKDVNQDNDVKQDNTPNKYVAPTKRILWVDDNPANNTLLVEQLKKMNYTVDIATNNQAALSELAYKAYEIIITDIARDKEAENGVNLLKKLPRQIAREDVIIYTSPDDEKKYGKEISGMGYYQVITKAADLVDIINKHKRKAAAN